MPSPTSVPQPCLYYCQHLCPYGRYWRPGTGEEAHGAGVGRQSRGEEQGQRREDKWQSRGGDADNGSDNGHDGPGVQRTVSGPPQGKQCRSRGGVPCEGSGRRGERRRKRWVERNGIGGISDDRIGGGVGLRNAKGDIRGDAGKRCGRAFRTRGDQGGRRRESYLRGCQQGGSGGQPWGEA